jgi:hypothetical protein
MLEAACVPQLAQPGAVHVPQLAPPSQRHLVARAPNTTAITAPAMEIRFSVDSRFRPSDPRTGASSPTAHPLSDASCRASRGHAATLRADTASRTSSQTSRCSVWRAASCRQPRSSESAAAAGCSARRVSSRRRFSRRGNSIKSRSNGGATVDTVIARRLLSPAHIEKGEPASTFVGGPATRLSPTVSSPSRVACCVAWRADV